MVVGPAGGTVAVGDGSSVAIPPGALSSPTSITMTSLAQAEVPGEGIAGGVAYALGPPDVHLAAPVTVTLSFNPASLPSMTQVSDLALFTAAAGTTDHAFWLGTRLADATHLSAQATRLSWIWMADTSALSSQAGPPLTTCGIGDAVCISFIVDEEGFCALCQCSDGSECPGGDPSQCCSCADGNLCPRNDPSLCGLCAGNPPSPVVSGVAAQSLGPNCPIDSEACLVCPYTDPVTCPSALCCPATHPACCGDGRTCGTSADACAGADAGDHDGAVDVWDAPPEAAP